VTTPALPPAEVTSPTDPQQEPHFWLWRFRSTIFFFLIVLTVGGIYLATQIPISVFPTTNLPRVVIGVDNGVMPVEQMQVTITKPIEDAIDIVPGLVTVRSTTSRGLAEVSLFFSWGVDMYQTLQLVDAALSRVQQSLPVALLPSWRWTGSSVSSPCISRSTEPMKGSRSISTY
jgi:multidrug efflux pump subunit AcrB